VNGGDRDTLTAYRQSDNAFKDLEDFTKQYGGTMLGTMPGPVKARGLALLSNAQDQYRTANGQGVFKESENHFIQRTFPDNPGSMFAQVLKLPSYQEARRLNNEKFRIKANSLGISNPGGMQPMSVSGGSAPRNFTPKTFQKAK
jgi:hypothetical protein